MAEMAELVRTIEIGGRTLPTLGVHPNGRMFVVPMENGWNAYVVAYPRPDETEYAVACLTRHEAGLVVVGEWGIGSELTHWNERPDNQWPRGDDDLLDALERLSQWPSPPKGFGLTRPSRVVGFGRATEVTE